MAPQSMSPTRRRGGVWLTLGIILVLLVGIAVGGYFFLASWSANPAHAQSADLFPNKVGMQWRLADKAGTLGNDVTMSVAQSTPSSGATTLALKIANGAPPTSDSVGVNLSLSSSGVTVEKITGTSSETLALTPPLPIIKTPFRGEQKWEWRGQLLDAANPADNSPKLVATITNSEATCTVAGKSQRGIHVVISMKCEPGTPVADDVQIEMNGDVVPHYGLVACRAKTNNHSSSHEFTVTLTPQFTYRPALGYQSTVPQAASSVSSPRDNRNTRNASMNNLRQLAVAALMYAQDNDETFPPVTTFAEIKTRINVDAKLCQSPVTGQPYAWNRHLAGAALGNISSPATTIMFYDSVDMPNGGRCAAFVDGHVEILSVGQWAQARSQVE